MGEPRTSGILKNHFILNKDAKKYQTRIVIAMLGLGDNARLSTGTARKGPP
jgi:hypothetical protein